MNRLTARMAPPDYTGRFRQWLGAVQAAMVTSRASVPPAVAILSRLSNRQSSGNL